MLQDGGAQTEHVLLGQTEHVLLGEETVELVLNEGSDLEDFTDSGYEENTVLFLTSFFYSVFCC